MILLNKHVLKKKITLIERGKYKTHVYVKFAILEPSSYQGKMLVVYGLKPFSHFKNNFIGKSHLTLTEDTKKSHHQHDVNEISVTALSVLSRKPVTIDFSFWGGIVARLKDDFLAEYNLDTSALEDNVAVSAIIDQLKAVMVEEMRRGEEEGKALREFKEINSAGEDDSDNEQYVKARFIKTPLYKRAEQDIQRLYYHLVIESLLSCKMPFYSSHYYDFRGRIYPSSSASFMYLKPMRAFFACERVAGGSALEESKYFNQVLSANVDFTGIFSAKVLSDYDDYMLRVCLLELGKIDKSKLINKEGVCLNEFIQRGIVLYENDAGCTIKYDDFGYYLSIKRAIKTFLECKRWENVTIIRDSTGSSFQH
jgi:hypothetical protein